MDLGDEVRYLGKDSLTYMDIMGFPIRLDTSRPLKITGRVSPNSSGPRFRVSQGTSETVVVSARQLEAWYPTPLDIAMDKLQKDLSKEVKASLKNAEENRLPKDGDCISLHEEHEVVTQSVGLGNDKVFKVCRQCGVEVKDVVRNIINSD